MQELQFEWDEQERGTRVYPEKKHMRKEYDLSRLKGRKNPYAKRLKKQVTIRMGIDVIQYFKGLSEETGLPYQNLINLYLRDCVVSRRKPLLQWSS